MINSNLGRRDFLRLTLLGGISGLASCSSINSDPVFSSALNFLPKPFLQALPAPWRFVPLGIKNDQRLLPALNQSKADLLAVGDGWLSSLPMKNFLKIEESDLRSSMNLNSKQFLGGLKPEIASRVLPIAFSPWVMVFMNGKDLVEKAQKDWDVLLSPELKGKVLLPETPRIIISIADRISKKDSLRLLRRQSIAMDDRNGLNWLLSGEAKVAVLPLNYCLKNMISDPRLKIAFPNIGAPLNWTLLIRPANSKYTLPERWIRKTMKNPLLEQLLAFGWIPPVLESQISLAIQNLPPIYHSVLLPSPDIWNRCWSLPSINTSESNRLEEAWQLSTP